jgi:tryptophan halogenase
MNYKTDKIVVLGGGSAGWMTAASLVKEFPNKKIVVVESPTIGIVGVGETTVQEIRPWLRYLDIDIPEFMRHTDATFKMATGFTNFYSENSPTFFNCFGLADFTNTLQGVDDWQIKKIIFPDTPGSDFTETYFPSHALLSENKFTPEELPQLFPFRPEKDTSFQVNANKLGDYLAEYYAIPKGVSRVIGTVGRVEGDEHGVSSLILEDGQKITGDIFIDCTGFKSLLLGEFLHEPFISTLDVLPHNKAFFTPVPYTNKNIELQNFTNCVALKNGWCWNIPLWSRIGTGYVYSDRFTDEESALQEFKNHLNSKNMAVYDPQRSEKVEIKKLFIRNGYHERSWVKNVVAIGLSAAFLDPIEGSGIFFVHEMLVQLNRVLSRGVVTRIDSESFNSYSKQYIESVMEFLEAHYLLSIRDDSEYWRHSTSRDINPKYIRTLSGILHDKGWSTSKGSAYVNLSANMNWQVVGQYGLSQYNFINKSDAVVELLPYWEAKNKTKDLRKKFAKTLPTQYEFLKANIHGENE